jgi:hypothetical protein
MIVLLHPTGEFELISPSVELGLRSVTLKIPEIGKSRFETGGAKA